MVEAAPDEGPRRRLPLWMKGVSAADQTKKSDTEDKNINVPEKGLAPSHSNAKMKPRNAVHSQKENGILAEGHLPCHSKHAGKKPQEITVIQENNGNLVEEHVPLNSRVKRKLGKTIVPQGKETQGENSCDLSKKGKTKRLKKKFSQHGTGFDVETALHKERYNRHERKVQKSTLEGETKALGTSSRSSEHIQISSADDDEELTVEDLLSIAREYVKADKDMEIERQKISIGKCERQFPATAFYRNDLGGSLDDWDVSPRSSVHETTIESTEGLGSEHKLINSIRTGDPAQDMLDLFLGPLLKKPMEEKRTDVIMKDVTFDNEFGKQSQSDVGEERVPLVKKKSSLRDKVAMLLD